MKKLFAVLLSLQLMMVPVALAQSSGDQFRKGAPKKGGMDLYAQQIMGLATSVIGANIITSCKLGSMLPSLMLFMGGSVVNIAGEIMAGKAQNENHKMRTSDLRMLSEKMKNTVGGDLQKEALEQALKEEKATLAFINKRKMWVMAVTAVYLAATAASFIEGAITVVGVAVPAGCWPSPLTGITSKAISFAYGAVAGKVGGGGAISTYGGMLLNLGTMVAGLNSAVAAAYNSPPARAITFGASTILMGLITKGLSDRASKTKANIADLEKAIANFKANSQPGNGIAKDNTNGANSGGTSSGLNAGAGAGGKIDTSSNKNYALNTLADGSTLPKECWSNTSKGMEYSSSSCKNPVRLPAVAFKGSLNVPTLSTAASLANDMSQNVANGNIEGAEASAAGLASMAGKLKEIKDNMAKQTNAKLVAEGKKPIDFDGESQKLASSMLADFDKASGTDSSSGLAGMNAGDSSPAVNEVEKTDDKSKINTASAGAVVEVPSAAGGLMTEDLVNDSAPTELAKSETPVVEYEYNQKDISDVKDVSLFQQVSNRYLFQYNKIFSKDEPVAEPVK